MMAFDKKTWANNQGGGTPLDASGLNDLESRITDSIDELDVDLASHKAESASKHITDSGSNANGRYVKFDDGTQICYINKDYTGVAIKAEYGALYRSDSNLQLSYPAPFISTPELSLGSKGSSVPFAYINSMTSTFFNFRPVRVTSNSSVDFSLSAIAIGRWK